MPCRPSHVISFDFQKWIQFAIKNLSYQTNHLTASFFLKRAKAYEYAKTKQYQTAVLYNVKAAECITDESKHLVIETY